MIVERIQTDHGSHIEPPYDESWDDLTGLQWKLAVALVDAGLPADALRVGPSNVQHRIGRGRRERWVPIPGRYGFSGSGWSGGSYTFTQAWDYLNGFTDGARAMSSALRKMAGYR